MTLELNKANGSTNLLISWTNCPPSCEFPLLLVIRNEYSKKVSAIELGWNYSLNPYRYGKYNIDCEQLNKDELPIGLYTYNVAGWFANDAETGDPICTAPYASGSIKIIDTCECDYEEHTDAFEPCVISYSYDEDADVAIVYEP